MRAVERKVLFRMEWTGFSLIWRATMADARFKILYQWRVFVPIYDEAGNLVATEGIARDITERKQAEE